MKNALRLVFLLALANSTWAQSKVLPDIASPAKRQDSIALADKLSKLNLTAEIQVPENLINPFDAAPIQPVLQASRPTSDRELLAMLSGQVNPTGTVALGGEPYLLFGQKRIKVGESIPISFESTVYELEIVAIERTTFTIRYKQEEFSRPVTISSTNKPGKNP